MQSKSMRVLAFGVALSLATLPCVGLGRAADAQTLQGILVLEKSHRPIANARLSLVDDSGRVVARTVSDSTVGAFYLTAPTKGRYSLEILVGHGGASHSPYFAMDSDQVLERTFAVPDWPAAVLDAYLPDDVTKSAAPTRDHPRYPRYPDRMRSAGRNGLVRTRFVIDTAGRPDMTTFQVVESSDGSFTDVVRNFVRESHFLPAERDGVVVPQVYDLVVDFGFGTDPPRVADKNAILIRALGITRRVERPQER